MAQDFRSARFWAAELMETALFPGARAVDATMGNGRDTLWLCQRVGPEGRVYAFDVQPEAVARTRALLEREGLSDRATLFCQGHQRMAELRAGAGGRGDVQPGLAARGRSTASPPGRKPRSGPWTRR